ncbi:DNA translocase FtsK [Thioalkalivibrio sp. HK1]|uniref:DNA translocase FtsK n=1 Tax=Thioalkalivibrio sp. HK1 TaxID=1469245 RepID=UPI000471320C|nr:DNA translocase FtsK [Thioalkalivibrio sp. HK1]
MLQQSRLHSNLLQASCELLMLVVGAIALYLLLALASYAPTDPGWSNATAAQDISNLGGSVGAWCAGLLIDMVGIAAWLLPLMIAYTGWLAYRALKARQGVDGAMIAIRASGALMLLCASCALAALYHHDASSFFTAGIGGFVGNYIGQGLVSIADLLGATLFLLVLFAFGCTLFTGIAWLSLMETIGHGTLIVLAYLSRGAKWLWAESVALFPPVRRGLSALLSLRRSSKSEPASAAAPRPASKNKPESRRIEPLLTTPPMEEPQVASPQAQVPSGKKARVKAQEKSAEAGKSGASPIKESPVAMLDLPSPDLPSLELLGAPQSKRFSVSTQALEAMSRQVESKLADFGVEAQVVAVHPGPVITRYELQLAPGIKVSRVSNLAKDLARSLSTTSVRIVEIIPGRTTVGLEIPNAKREFVGLVELLKSQPYRENPAGLPLALGMDISGQPVVVDLARMPHLLVAGTTGSGKSVAINAMILSLLYRATADEVRMIMIDPKMLELSVYEGIPHLLSPVVTDMKDAANALQWCVDQMDRRYRLMSALGVRHIAGYNRKLREASLAGSPILDPFFAADPMSAQDEEEDAPTAPPLAPLPLIVVIIDELADMMMITGKKVETLIARLAQKARAAGIHLVLATQRPSVDVITGLIKANIPCRIAFQVSSKIDSRTILDQQGAENLLGKGDMLYMGPGSSALQRLHGPNVSDQEVHRVVAHLQQSESPDYIDSFLDSPASREPPGSGEGFSDLDSEEGKDPFYEQAVDVVIKTRRASISGVQRRLRVGYNRAARMLEEMERSGVVGPQQPNGSREVLAPAPPSTEESEER